MSIGHEAVELRALVFAATDSKIEVGIDQTPAARLGELLKVARLHGNILAVIGGGNSSVDCYSV
jgi:actin-like ATPase involved in cell morphogenesis